MQDKKSPFEGDESAEQLDPRFEEAVEIVLETGTASTSFLQRKLSVGYARGGKNYGPAGREGDHRSPGRRWQSVKCGSTNSSGWKCRTKARHRK